MCGEIGEFIPTVNCDIAWSFGSQRPQRPFFRSMQETDPLLHPEKKTFQFPRLTCVRIPYEQRLILAFLSGLL
jgi:hypothetical protein